MLSPGLQKRLLLELCTFAELCQLSELKFPYQKNTVFASYLTGLITSRLKTRPGQHGPFCRLMMNCKRLGRGRRRRGRRRRRRKRFLYDRRPRWSGSGFPAPGEPESCQITESVSLPETPQRAHSAAWVRGRLWSTRTANVHIWMSDWWRTSPWRDDGIPPSLAEELCRAKKRLFWINLI